MALHRKKMKKNGDFIRDPVRCSICKEKKAYKTVHGGLVTYQYGGQTCCDDCYAKVQEEERTLQDKKKDFEPTEADRQTWMKL